MGTEIFRFATIRPPQTSTDDPTLANAIYISSDPGSALVNNLRKAKEGGSRDEMIKLASAYAATSDFIDSKNKIDEKYTQLAAMVRSNSSKPTDSYFEEGFGRIFNTNASDLVKTSDFQKIRSQLDDSLVAAVMLTSLPSKTKSFIIYLRYTVFLIGQLAQNTVLSQNILDKKIVLPWGIFPLPVAGQSLADSKKDQKVEYDQLKKQNAERLNKLGTQLENQTNAIKELVGAFERYDVKNDIPASARIAAPSSVSETKKIAFLLPTEVTDKLTANTKNVLTSQGIMNKEVDVAKAVNLLEKNNAEIAAALYSNSGPGQVMVHIGSLFLPSSAINPSNFPVKIFPGRQISMGPCPPAPIDTLPTNETVTIPSGHGEARILGIADLMVVEQELARYELGEISHIENILKSELREHKLTTSQTTDITNLTETEVTDQKSQDLTSTDRYELQTETQNIINTDSSKEAGITVNASYGPSVSVTANYNTTNNTSTQDSRKASSNFARDTTARAVSSVEKRTLQRQTIRTINKIRELNKHNFDNSTGDDNITGIYRWLNKIYKAQIVNYGKRLMLEFIVPEPSAFLRYAMTHAPVDNITLINPDPPGYCLEDGKTFQPLKVQDITRENYLFWVSKYSVQDATPPPARLNIVSSSLVDNGDSLKDNQLEDGTPVKIGSTKLDVSITEGYVPYTAGLNLHGNQGEKAILTVQIQDLEVSNNTIGGFGRVNLNNTATQSIPITVNSLNFYCYEIIVNILCTLSAEKFQQWQLSTFNSIMGAYNDQKTKYDDAVQAAKIRAGFTQIQGKNPLLNRETEKTELKRSCISLLTGQRFETFDAMTPNVAPYGYPEIDFAEAKAEGDYIRFFEQSFEWTNITYVFYPYFWSNKNEWVMLAQLDDDDPLFAKFLQAGAARVQVPVRTGFEEAMLHYLSLGELWNGEGTLVNSVDGDPDPMQISVVDELKSQSGNNSIDGKGTISVTKDSAAVTGTGTEFSESDTNRRIIIKGVTYIIKKRISETSIVLTANYGSDTETDLTYALGGVLVGQSWEITLPSDLIKIDNASNLIV